MNIQVSSAFIGRLYVTQYDEFDMSQPEINKIPVYASPKTVVTS